MQTNIKSQVQYKYSLTQKEKKSVFQAENGFPVLLIKNNIILGPVQTGKQNQQIKHAPLLTFKIHYVSKYQTIQCLQAQHFLQHY